MRPLSVRTHLLAPLIATAVALSVASTATAGQLFHAKGASAWAYFDSVDASGCLHTFVYLEGGESAVQEPPGSPDANSWSWVYVSRYDACAYTWTAAGGFAQGVEFRASKALRDATLRGTVVVYDYSTGMSSNLAIDIAWVGSGDLYRSHSSYFFMGPGVRSSSRWQGSFREGKASGTVSDGSINLTPGGSVYASLGTSSYHSVSVD